MPDEPVASMVDLAFVLEGDCIPRDHRGLLADALESALPCLSRIAGAAVHRLNISAGAGPQALLSRRTRLTLRVPRARAADAAALAGSELKVGSGTLRVGSSHARELLPHGALYAHLVAADDNEDETAFLRTMAAELATLGVACRPICGRHQVVEAGALQGFSLMLDGLSPTGSLRVLEAGLGPHRRLGCGVFVPHKSTAAVGA